MLKSTVNKSAAQKFIDFCVSKKGKDILKEKGFYVNRNWKFQISKNMKVNLILLLLLLLLTACNSKKKQNEIIVLSGASMRAPMEEIKKL